MSSHAQHERVPSTLTQRAVQATLHCLTGCAVGEILGMVIATALGWVATASIRHLAGARCCVSRTHGRMRSAPTVTAMVQSIAATRLDRDEGDVGDVFIVRPGASLPGLRTALWWWSRPDQPACRLPRRNQITAGSSPWPGEAESDDEREGERRPRIADLESSCVHARSGDAPRATALAASSIDGDREAVRAR